VDLYGLEDHDYNFSLNQLVTLHDRIKTALYCKKGKYNQEDMKRLQVVIECFSKFHNNNRKIVELTNDLWDFYDKIKDFNRINEKEPNLIDYKNKLYTHNQEAKDQQLKEEKLDKRYDEKIQAIKKNELIKEMDRRDYYDSRSRGYQDYLNNKLQLQEDRLMRKEKQEMAERNRYFNIEKESYANQKELQQQKKEKEHREYLRRNQLGTLGIYPK
jgi:hypothetical protein